MERKDINYTPEGKRRRNIAGGERIVILTAGKHKKLVRFLKLIRKDVKLLAS